MKPSQIDKTLNPGAIAQAQRLADRLYPPEPYQRHPTSMADWLKDDDCATLEEIAQELGCTREYVRQIQNQALRKCQQWCRRNGLKLSDLLPGWWSG
jgi:DNA-directed RNA polymerase sigma subunit (sigma70/sigma32)